jgi:hypothetical protein
MPLKIGEVAEERKKERKKEERKKERARPTKNDPIFLTIHAWGSKTSEH